jgi:DNA-binding NarL/FixJ family response regulator
LVYSSNKINHRAKLVGLGMRAIRSASALMTTNNIHVLAGKKPASRILFADHDPNESAIAIRAIKRRCASLEIWSVAALADAAEVLARERIDTVLAGSGLDGRTLPQTIRWFARNGPGAAIVALLEQPDHRHRQEALEAGASAVCSKPELLVAQLRHELESRRSASVQEHTRKIG